MSLSFANTAGNLFNRLGRFGKLADKARVFQGDLFTYFNLLMAQYDSSVASPLQLPIDGIPSLRDATRQGAADFMATLSANAALTVTEMVKADKPTSAGSLQEALLEVRRQMIAAGASIKACAVSATAAAASGNKGDGVVVVSSKRGDGLTQELMYPEVAYIRCTSDSQTGGATAGQEGFTYYGPVAAASVWSYDYPINSGLTTPIVTIDGSVDVTTNSANLLSNGDMESFTSGTPDGWTVLVGTPNTNLRQATAAGKFYDGAGSLEYVGNSSTLTSIYYPLDTTLLFPLTSYALNFWAKVDVVPAAGVLTVDLVDSTNTVINDDQGVANSQTFAITGWTTSFVNKNVVFRTPRLLPSGVRVRVRLSTAVTTGSSAFMDRFAFGALTQLYPGGPGAAIFSGATKFATEDYFTLTSTNDYGGASNLSTFHWLLDRMLSLRSLGVLLPTNGAPTISDTLITS